MQPVWLPVLLSQHQLCLLIPWRRYSARPSVAMCPGHAHIMLAQAQCSVIQLHRPGTRVLPPTKRAEARHENKGIVAVSLVCA